MTKHIIVYSHGFGVDKTDRGLFTDIAATLPNTEPVMFDYNVADIPHKTITVSSLREQSKMFTEVMHKVRSENPSATIDLVCHSMGCVAAAIAHPENVRRVVFLAPPDNVGVDRFKEIFNRPGAEVNLGGLSKLTRMDGSTTLVPKEFWDSLQPLNVLKLYDALSQLAELTIISADEDEVVGPTDFTKTNENIKLINLRADHNFTGESRAKLCELLKGLLG